MGSMRKAMIRSGISFDRVPNEQEQKDASEKWKHKNNFAGMAKKRNRKEKVAQQSLTDAQRLDCLKTSAYIYLSAFQFFVTHSASPLLCLESDTSQAKWECL
jgi:hypothetical protein